jgi:hypothetical protein
MARRLVGAALMLVLLTLAGIPRTAAAQSPIRLAVEPRVGAAFPLGTLGDHAETGSGWGVSATVQLVPNYGLYGGYSRTEFDLDAGERAIDSGFSVGLSAAYPGLFGGLTPWLGTGLLIHDLEVEGVAIPAGDSSVGFEVGGGVVVPLAPRIRLTPGIGYRQYRAPFIGDANATISYLSLAVGLNLAF